MHQLVNSCSQVISSVTIFELNFDCWEKYIFPRTDFHYIFKILNQGLWVWSSSNELPFQRNGLDCDLPLNPLELVDMSYIRDRMTEGCWSCFLL